MREVKLKCRLSVCDTDELFEDFDEAEESEWTEIGKMGVNRGGTLEYPAFCPGHSLE